jgi:hypothetical protein
MSFFFSVSVRSHHSEEKEKNDKVDDDKREFNTMSVFITSFLQIIYLSPYVLDDVDGFS